MVDFEAVRAAIFESRPEVVTELKEIFGEFGIEVAYWTPKGSGWQADFQKIRPEIVFIDYLLPGRDGMTTLEKAVELTNQPYYFFMHSYRGIRANELEEKAFVLGADAVIQKPLVKSRLRASLERVIRARDQHSSRKMKLVFKE